MPAHMKKRQNSEKSYEVFIKSGTIKRCLVPLDLFVKINKYEVDENSNEDEVLMPIEEFFKSIGEEFGTPASAIKGYRARDGMTQQELADKLGVKQTHISEMENGKRTVGKA